MSEILSTVTNLELRESNPDGSEGAGLSHTAEGMFLLHCLEMAGAGEPRGGVTIVHDLSDHGERYRGLGARLTEDDWALALPDMRGHGRSEGPRGHSWGIKEPVRDIDSVQDHVAYRLPDHPKVIIGVGLGGLYALAYAQAHPDRVQALVLVGAMLQPTFPVAAKPGGLKGLFKKPTPIDQADLDWSPDQISSDASAQSAWTGDPLVHRKVSRHVAERVVAEAAEVRRHAASMTVPTLALHGSDDTIASVDAVRGIERAGLELRVLDGRRHDLLHEAGAKSLYDDIAHWIDGVCPR
ncbi:alpha/beta fold hydrolase [Engelhardtia mirabilis]|uniref:Phospholipase YtpA n=1 Tax=Engelhardtia mirabilis TaxID=2528011 RepID=A0A518BJ36_9BACT|nr:Phospholipase YtpA [Planctomycetes bacterium Pla133]QDV01309.1 Phospholipase YtpA [Planctomycetes bacterium Pla86]